jgi:hypothetical protein
MHVLMGVLGSVVVGVGVLVLDMLVFVCVVRVCVSDPAMLVFVRMRPFMGVLFSHSDRLLCVRNTGTGVRTSHPATGIIVICMYKQIVAGAPYSTRAVITAPLGEFTALSAADG